MKCDHVPSKQSAGVRETDPNFFQQTLCLCCLRFHSTFYVSVSALLIVSVAVLVFDSEVVGFRIAVPVVVVSACEMKSDQGMFQSISRGSGNCICWLAFC